jgi:hypothetical protein
MDGPNGASESSEGILLIPSVVLAAILKHAGVKSLLMRCASKTTKQVVDAAYHLTCYPRRIVVHYNALTDDRLLRVRRIAAGANPSVAVVLVLACHVDPSAGPSSDDIGCIRAYLDAFPADTVELRLGGWGVEGSEDRVRMRALRDRISGARVAGCTIREWHLRALTHVLPPTLRRLSIEGCVIDGAVGTLGALLSGFDRLSGLTLRYVSYDDPTVHWVRFEALAPALAKMHDLEDLDLHGIVSHPATVELIAFIGAARRLRTLRLAVCLRTVPVSLITAMLTLPSLRELDLGNTRVTFELLDRACRAIKEESPTAIPAPALEVLDLRGTRLRPSGIAPVGGVGPAAAASFLRAVPSLKELYLQDTGATARGVCDIGARNVVFHLSSAGAVAVALAASHNVRVRWHESPLLSRSRGRWGP